MIDIHELTKRFESGGREILAVDGLSFNVQPGEVYGLLGPNGAGKTTTIRMIFGLLEPDEGARVGHGAAGREEGRPGAEVPRAAQGVRHAPRRH